MWRGESASQSPRRSRARSTRACGMCSLALADRDADLLPVGVSSFGPSVPEIHHALTDPSHVIAPSARPSQSARPQSPFAPRPHHGHLLIHIQPDSNKAHSNRPSVPLTSAPVRAVNRFTYHPGSPSLKDPLRRFCAQDPHKRRGFYIKDASFVFASLPTIKGRIAPRRNNPVKLSSVPQT